MNYRSELEHDRLLISLVNELDVLGDLSPLTEVLGLSRSLGKLENAQRRQGFDVELTFQDASVVIETKVDSDESGRWDGSWQTENIFKSADSYGFLKEEKHFVFITYGTSEFYTKPYTRGPACKHFLHLRLNDMVSLVSKAIPLLHTDPTPQYHEWLALMQIEQQKRDQALSLLARFAEFRDSYLSIHQDVDFPNHRFSFCAPELAFPLFGLIAYSWNDSPDCCESLGRVAVYPVGRLSPSIPDSILNFAELWESGKPSCGGRNEQFGSLYFEMNEDCNLNLKLDAETLDEGFAALVHKKIGDYAWPIGVRGRPRQYHQGTYVLYEWDYGLLNSLREAGNTEPALNQLHQVVSGAVEALD